MEKTKKGGRPKSEPKQQYKRMVTAYEAELLDKRLGEVRSVGPIPEGYVLFEREVDPAMVPLLDEAMKMEEKDLAEALGLDQLAAEVIGDPRPVAERSEGHSKEYEENLKANWPGPKEPKEFRMKSAAEMKKLPGVKPGSELAAKGPTFVPNNDLGSARSNSKPILP